MTNKYTTLDIDDYHRVEYCENDTVGLRAWISVHNINRGPSLGGCRLWNYTDQDSGLLDALRLSRGMSYKNAMAELDFGGGKSVIWSDPANKTDDLFRAMGEFVEHMGGDYIVAEDVNITCEDIRIMREVTDFTCDPDIGDPGPYTARGVLRGIKAACEHKYGTYEPKDLKVLVQGAGSVGMGIIVALKSAGAQVCVVDINEGNLLKAMAHGASPVLQEEMHEQNCQIYIPCALGGVVSPEILPRLLSYDIIAGSANNVLLFDSDGQELHHNGILYAPDYVINSGGVIAVAAAQISGFDQNAVFDKLDGLADTLKEVFEESDKQNLATNVVADQIAEKRLGV